MQPAVRLKEVSRLYTAGGVTTAAVDRVSLEIQSGEFVALVGRSGSGKSTLLSLIGTLDVPTSGRVWVNETETTQLRGAALADFRFQHIGVIFQQFHLLSSLTALENVLTPLFPRRVPFNKRDRALELLAAVGLEDKAHRLPSELSGGEQQRVSIARALVASPSLLLADEPTGNLDQTNGNMIFELLSRINNDQKVTVIVVTHDPRLADQAERTIELVDGKLAGTAQSLAATNWSTSC